MGFFDGLVKTIFDPAGIFGNWEDTPGGPAPAPKPQDNGYMSEIMRAQEEYDRAMRREQMWGAGGDKVAAPLTGKSAVAASAFNPDVKVKPSDWSAQWSYTPGKGPQWIEPKRVSSDNDVPYAAQVNNGPAKGNRF